MNVLYLTHQYLPSVGGVQRSVYNLTRLMSGRGHQIAVASHGSHPFRVRRDVAPSLQLHIPSPFERRWAGRAACAVWDTVNVSVLAAWCRRRRIEIVHCHLINVDTRYALSLSRRLGIPVVVTLRGGETEHWLAPSPARRPYVSEILRGAHHVTAVAGSLLDSATALDPTLASRSTVVRNPVDREALLAAVPPTGPQEPGPPYIVFVGRLEEMKDVGTLIDAIHRVFEREPTTSLELRIIGSGSLRESLTKAASVGAASGRIRFLGSRSHGECLAQIRNAAALVLPSKMSEGCPNVVLESVVLGTPVLVSDLPALSELVTDGDNGAVFARGDSERLAKLILELQPESDTGAEPSRRAAQALLARHDPRTIARVYEGIYERVLRENIELS